MNRKALEPGISQKPYLQGDYIRLTLYTDWKRSLRVPWPMASDVMPWISEGSPFLISPFYFPSQTKLLYCETWKLHTTQVLPDISKGFLVDGEIASSGVEDLFSPKPGNLYATPPPLPVCYLNPDFFLSFFFSDNKSPHLLRESLSCNIQYSKCLACVNSFNSFFN